MDLWYVQVLSCTVLFSEIKSHYVDQVNLELAM